jgi:hypothetical protein
MLRQHPPKLSCRIMTAAVLPWPYQPSTQLRAEHLVTQITRFSANLDQVGLVPICLLQDCLPVEQSGNPTPSTSIDQKSSGLETSLVEKK